MCSLWIDNTIKQSIMKKKLVNFDDQLFDKLVKKAQENRRPVMTEITIAVEEYLTKQ